MCEHSSKLVAWIDGELLASQASEIERHVASCADCRSCLAEFRKVSGSFEAYCEELVRAEEGRKAIPLQSVLWAAAAAVLLAGILGYSRRHVTPVEQPSHPAMAATNSSSSATMQAAESVPAPFPPKHHRAHRPLAVSASRGAGYRPCAVRDCPPASAETESARWAPEELTVQIAIPASAMFPPGAVPEDMSFVADLSIAPDGSARQVRLQREIPELERRLTQP